MVESFAAHTGGSHKHFQIVDNLLLAGEGTERQRTHGALDLFLRTAGDLAGSIAYVEIFTHFLGG